MLMFLLTLILMLIIIIFAIQNADIVTVKFVAWKFDLPKAILLFIALIAGALLSAFWHAIRYVSFSRVFKEFSKQIKELEEKLKEKDEELEVLRGNTPKNEDH